MRIKKTFQTTVPTGKVLNSYTESNVDTYNCNYINGLETYSTNETRIGTWIDGKPIYRKVLTGNSGNLQNITTVNIGQNVSKVLKIDGFISDSSNNYVPINYANNNASIWAYWNTNDLKIQSSVNYFSNMPYYIILEYTKTTD